MDDSLTTPNRNPETALSRDPAHWVEDYGDYLFRYATMRVGNTDTAKDLVQETFLAALKGRAGFSGRSSPKTWLVAILKHKIADHFRRSVREAPAPGGDPEAAAFRADGRWQQAPGSWHTDPGEALHRREFWVALRNCLSALPRRQAAAFSLREFDGLATEEICQVFDTTATNIWVLLHRARLGLRRCLESAGLHPGKERV